MPNQAPCKTCRTWTVLSPNRLCVGCWDRQVDRQAEKGYLSRFGKKEVQS